MYVTGVTVFFFSVTLYKMCHMWHDNNFTSIEFCFTQELRFKGLHHYLFITGFFFPNIFIVIANRGSRGLMVRE